MNERTDEWKRVKHIQYSVWRFSQSAYSTKVMVSIQRFFCFIFMFMLKQLDNDVLLKPSLPIS